MKDFFSLRTIRNTIVAAALAMAPAAAFAGVFISVGFAPPALPVYVQPVAPGDGSLWNPGYWAYAPAGYYWVPGVWVRPPQVGLLWTPPYWGFEGGLYGFHEGYWGPHVGFYGGVNYGFGYGGVGFGGGHWNGGFFSYNTAVMNIGVGVGFHSTFVDRTVIVNNNFSHASFNGPGGIQARPSPQEQQWSHENHIAPTAEQQSHFQAARSDRANFASANGGRPAHVTAVTVNNYRSTTVNNNHNVANSNERVNNNERVSQNDVHEQSNVHNGQTNVRNNNTENNRTAVNGNRDAVRGPAKPQANSKAQKDERPKR